MFLCCSRFNENTSINLVIHRKKQMHTLREMMAWSCLLYTSINEFQSILKHQFFVCSVVGHAADDIVPVDLCACNGNM